MEIASHIEAIEREGQRLAAAASRAGLDGSIRWCPVWNRGDDSAIDLIGDRSVLDTWRNRHRSRWPRTRDEDDARAQVAR